MRLSLLTGILFAGTLVVGCGGGNQPDPGPQDPGLVRDGGVDYPPSPYGTNVGDTIADIANFGYPGGTAAWDVVRLSDFYDPQQNRGPEGIGNKALWVNVSARWCSYCEGEAPTMVRKCQQNRSKGLVCYTAIFEDVAGDRSTRKDVDYWKRMFKIDYPIVDDGPSFKWGSYFDAAGTPMNMFVDLRTMRIKHIVTGANMPEIEAALADVMK